MNDCLYELYMITKKPEHKIAAHYFDETPLFELVASGGENSSHRRHANTTIPKFVGALKRYVALIVQKKTRMLINTSIMPVSSSAW